MRQRTFQESLQINLGLTENCTNTLKIFRWRVTIVWEEERVGGGGRAGRLGTAIKRTFTPPLSVLHRTPARLYCRHEVHGESWSGWDWHVLISLFIARLSSSIWPAWCSPCCWPRRRELLLHPPPRWTSPACCSPSCSSWRDTWSDLHTCCQLCNDSLVVGRPVPPPAEQLRLQTLLFPFLGSLQCLPTSKINNFHFPSLVIVC